MCNSKWYKANGIIAYTHTGKVQQNILAGLKPAFVIAITDNKKHIINYLL